MNEDTRKHIDLWMGIIRNGQAEHPKPHRLDPNVEPDNSMIEFMRSALYNPRNPHISDEMKAELLEQYIDGRMYLLDYSQNNVVLDSGNEAQVTFTMSYDYYKDKDNKDETAG